ncbi:MAG: YciI family protein, partial [Candidatus Dormibacteria bacterium]
MANFALTLDHGPAWDQSIGAREQKGWDEHAAFMDGLVEAGFILFGGPIGDHRKTLHLVEATDENEIRQRLAQDPWAQARLLEVGSILPWALWLDFRSIESGRR